MYISQVELTNFRKYKNKLIKLNKGLNVFLGENNSGKTAVIDAVRYVIDTDYNTRIHEDDFSDCKTELSITLKFDDLTCEEESAFLEYLNYERLNEITKATLYLSLNVSKDRLFRNIKSGKNREIDIDMEARQLIGMSYFRPLRDAESELAPKRQSRLSKIIQNYKHADMDKDKDKDKDEIKETLDGFYKALNEIEMFKDINKNTIDNLRKLLLYPDSEKFETSIGITSIADKEKIFKQITEKLKLDFSVQTKQGLGYYNLLFMAVELLLLKNTSMSSFLLIEEPEAHLHPQLQYNFLKFIIGEIEGGHSLQVFITTHSPNISSKVGVSNLFLLTSKDSSIYSLSMGETNATEEDYRFAEKFLDVTKSNIFFAKGIIFVEGFSEKILFPVFAGMLGYDLEIYGVSVVSIDGTSHKRYAKILQRKDGSEIAMPVSFVRDRDNLSDEGLKEMKEEIETSNMLKFFSSSGKNLEYDILSNMRELACDVLKTLYKDKEKVDEIERDNEDKLYEKIKNRRKSEFAYALAGKLTNKKTEIPEYIKDAIEYVVSKLEAIK